MKNFITVILLALTFFSGYSQNDDAIKYAGTINRDDLYSHISVLASDSLEGRETGQRGQKMAASYIRSNFEKLGLQPPVDTTDGKSYYQSFKLTKGTSGDTYMKIDGKKKVNGLDVLYWGTHSTEGNIQIEAIYAGNGSDLTNMDLNGKAVIMSIGGDFNNLTRKRDLAVQQGADLILIIYGENERNHKKLIEAWRPYFMNPEIGFAPDEESNRGGVFFISSEQAAGILKASTEKLNDVLIAQMEGNTEAYSEIKPSSLIYKSTWLSNVMSTENVLGYLEGTDRKDEIIIVTAHYDHEGIKGDVIYNGADDDASGTSSLLEIAEAFVKAKSEGKGPRRSILFMTVTGEEKGLIGSEYYVSHPVFPLNKTVVDLNIDMVGRIDPKHEDNPNYVYLVGADKLSSELHQISEKVNDTYTQFELDYTYNEEANPEKIYYRSDHWNFAKNNVPVIFYYNGTHADYHKPTDTIEKIEFDLLTKRAQFVFHTAWELANRDKRIALDKMQKTSLGSK